MLTQHASAIPLDPEWEFPRTEGAGLLLAYEKTGYDKILPATCPIWEGAFFSEKCRTDCRKDSARIKY